MPGAGKGDDYRPVNKKKFDENFVYIFGEKDIMDFHKDKRSDTKKEGIQINASLA